MTEAEWLGCEDPGRMLEWLTAVLAPSPAARLPCPPPSDRKLRLFACAVERHRMSRYTKKYGKNGKKRGPAQSDDEYWRSREVLLAQVEDQVDGAASRRGFVAGFFGGDSPVEDARIACRINTDGLSPLPVKAALLHDIIGNPWRPYRVDTIGTAEALCWYDVLDWRDRLIPKMARAVYDRRDWVALPVLADALEEAGCPAEEVCPKCDGRGGNEPDAMNTWRCGYCAGTGVVPSTLLAHLRGPGPHARGCWALDLILGKG